MRTDTINARQGIPVARRIPARPWVDPVRTAEPQRAASAAPADPEVPAKAARRRFTAADKLRILKLADACTVPGSRGALLRREGLYSSDLTTWRRQREAGTLSALTPQKRGRKAPGRDPLRRENAQLRTENERLTRRLRQAELIMDVQNKVSQMLGIPLATVEAGDSD
ncbi:MAG: transposase [candidate division NC10 bacterium]|nr:transposase [candidate division NC10 bacterium]MDE2320755.1 transposase [candidate division NC10 bacterium]